MYQSTGTGLSHGKHNLTVYATDKSGNVGASETINFRVDTSSPTSPVVAASVVVLVVAVTTVILIHRKKRK